MEQDYVHGLHVLPKEFESDRANIAALQSEFERRLADAGVVGEFTVEVGNTARKICDLAAWVDLVIMNIAHPPGRGPLKKITSGLRTIIYRSPRPLVLVPGITGAFSNLLLAYDGSPKANEALYISAYLTGKWGLQLTVLSIESARVGPQTLQIARDYLEGQDLEARYLLQQGDQAENILAVARQIACDAILMGGYGYSPVLEMVLGSAVDRVLREAEGPVYLCR